MATNLKSTNPKIDLTRFWGGEKRGSCILVSTPNRNGENFQRESIQLSRSEACALAMDLLDFSSNREREEI